MLVINSFCYFVNIIFYFCLIYFVFVCIARVCYAVLCNRVCMYVGVLCVRVNVCYAAMYYVSVCIYCRRVVRARECLLCCVVMYDVSVCILCRSVPINNARTSVCVSKFKFLTQWVTCFFFNYCINLDVISFFRIEHTLLRI